VVPHAVSVNRRLAEYVARPGYVRRKIPGTHGKCPGLLGLELLRSEGNRAHEQSLHNSSEIKKHATANCDDRGETPDERVAIREKTLAEADQAEDRDSRPAKTGHASERRTRQNELCG
jgi:hypothetical protein